MEPKCLSGAVSDEDKRGEKLAKLCGGHRRPLQGTASLPPFGQFGVGWRREAHGACAYGHHLRRRLFLALCFQVVLLCQLPVHGHRLSGEKRQVLGAAVPVGTEKEHLCMSKNRHYYSLSKDLKQKKKKKITFEAGWGLG